MTSLMDMYGQTINTNCFEVDGIEYIGYNRREHVYPRQMFQLLDEGATCGCWEGDGITRCRCNNPDFPGEPVHPDGCGCSNADMAQMFFSKRPTKTFLGYSTKYLWKANRKLFGVRLSDWEPW